MYNIAICDDEPLFADSLQQQLNNILFPLEIEYQVTVFYNPQELLTVLLEHPDTYHLLLLDIMMGEDNGIAIAKTLRENHNINLGIIFITVNPGFALDGYIIRPIQYLLKPVDYDKLKEAILFDYHQRFVQKHLLISSGSVVYSFSYNEICYIEVIGHTLRICKKEDAVECIGVLSDLQSKLPDNFLRCHKSFLVNLDWVSDIRRYSFQLNNGKKIPISKGRYNEIQQAFVAYATR